MSTQEERLQTVESDLQHFKAETVKAYGDMAVDLTLIKGIALKSMERLTIVETKLDNHTERFDHLETTLGEHTRVLYDHTIQFNRLETTLGEHTRVLHDHTSILKEHTARFDRLETTLDKQGERINRLETTLGEHTTLLTQILARLPEKP